MPRIASGPPLPGAGRHCASGSAGTMRSQPITVTSTLAARNAATRWTTAATCWRRCGAAAFQVKATAAKVRPGIARIPVTPYLNEEDDHARRRLRPGPKGPG